MAYDETKVVKLGQAKQEAVKVKEQIGEVAETAAGAIEEMATALATKQDATNAVQFVIPGDAAQWDSIVNYKYRLSDMNQLLDSNNEKAIFTDDQGQEYSVVYEDGGFYKARSDGFIMEDAEGLPIALSGFELFKFCDIPVQNLVVGDRVDVAIDPASMDAAAGCGLCPVTESLDGVFRLFANDSPTGDISAQYWVTKGKEGATTPAYGVVNVSGPSVADLTKKVEELSSKVALLDHAIFMVPSPLEDLVYTGEVQSPVWDNFNREQLTISGDISDVGPGERTAIFTPVEGYHWIDGTTTSKSVIWKISKPPVIPPSFDLS